MTSLIALAHNSDQADRIVHRLREEAHLADPELALLGPRDRHQDYDQVEELVTHAKAPGSTKTHGLTGGALGALVGVSTIIIPGLQPLLLAGPAFLAFGAFIGAAAGGAIGALTALGLPDAEVEKYRSRVEHGEYLIAVQSNDEAHIRQSLRVLESEHAAEIAEAHDPKRAA